jgi:hypothetical protein
MRMIGVAVLVGWLTVGLAGEALRPDPAARAAGAVAVAYAGLGAAAPAPAPAPKPPAPAPSPRGGCVAGCPCGFTGKVDADGSGIMVPCECPTTCPCKRRGGPGGQAPAAARKCPTCLDTKNVQGADGVIRPCRACCADGRCRLRP